MLGVECALASLELAAEIPSMEMFVSSSDLIRNEKTCKSAHVLHMHVCNHGLDSYEALGTCVLRTFVDCRDISFAQKLFNRLNFQDEFAYTSLIRGHAEYGDPQEALNLYHKMHKSFVSPSMFTFTSLLKACVNLEHLEKGQGLHMDITMGGWDIELGVGSSLMDMYSKRAALAEAQDTFERLPTHDVVSWTTLVLGYVDCGLGERALECFEEMQGEGVVLDGPAYVCGLKACGSIGAIDASRKIYEAIAKGGFDSDLFVGNALVSAYAKCGLPFEAHEVFDRLPAPDVVSWNSLINGYADYGYCEEALYILERMRWSGVTRSSITFIGGLKACDGIGAIHKAQELYAEIIEEGFEHNQRVGNALLGTYAKCGFLLEAQDIFDNLHVQDSVSWTSLIAGYSEHGQERDALNCFERMQVEGMPPEIPTYVCSLKACATLRDLNLGLKLHTDVAVEGFETDIIINNALVDLYAKCGLLTESHDVFNCISNRDVVSWNALTAGCTDHGLGTVALHLLTLMQGEGESPNSVTYICGLKACALVGALSKGQELYYEIVAEGYEEDSYVGNTIIDMYLKCGAVFDAQGVFDELSFHDAVTWSALLMGYAELGHGDAGLRLFEQMQLEGISRDINAWDAVILGLVEQGEGEFVFRFYAQLQEHGLLPSVTTFFNVLNACGCMAALGFGRKIHASVHRLGLHPAHVGLTNALIDMYCSCGNTVEAQQLFETLPVKDIVTWNTIITGYSRQGESKHFFSFLKKMREEEIEPGTITFLSALMLCNHAGFALKGELYFETIVSQYSTSCSIKHYHCMADLLSRAGRIDEAVALLGMMPFKPDLTTWHIMLGACQKSGRVKLGTRAFDGAMRMNQRHSASFISMSNMLSELYEVED